MLFLKYKFIYFHWSLITFCEPLWVSLTVEKLFISNLENSCFWTVLLEKTLESPLDCKEIKPVNSKGNQSWIFIGRTDAEAEAPILWPPDGANSLEKTVMLEKIEGRRRKGWQKISWLDGITNLMYMSLSMLWGFVMGREACRSAVYESQRVGHDWMTELNWMYWPFSVKGYLGFFIHCLGLS